MRQTPPILDSFSIKITFLPKSEDLNAAVYPPGPEPITTISVDNSFVKIIYFIFEGLDIISLNIVVNFAASAPFITR